MEQQTLKTLSDFRGFDSTDAEMIYQIGLRSSLNNEWRNQIDKYLGQPKSQHSCREYTERKKRRKQEVLEHLRKEHPYRNYTSNQVFENEELTAISGIRCFTHIDIVETLLNSYGDL